MEDELEPRPAPIDNYVSHYVKYSVTEAALERQREKEFLANISFIPN